MAFKSLGIDNFVRLESWLDLYKIFEAHYRLNASEKQCKDWAVRQAALLGERRKAAIADKHEMRTSGYSSGVSNKYFWGPDFMVFHEFVSRMFVARSLHFSQWLNAKNTCFDVKEIGSKDTRCDYDITRMYGDDCCATYELSRLNVDNKDAFAMAIEQCARIARGGMASFSPSVLQVISARRDVAYLFETIFKDNGLSTIGLTFEHCPATLKKSLVGMGFSIADYMRCWDGGATFYTCRCGCVHWIDMLSMLNAADGLLSSSDIWNGAGDFFNYANGDIVEFGGRTACECGLMRYSGSLPNRMASNDDESLIDLVVRSHNDVCSIVIDPIAVRFFSCKEPSQDTLKLTQKLTGALCVEWRPYVQFYRGKVRKVRRL